MQKTVTINNVMQEVTNEKLLESGVDSHVFMMTNDMIPELLQLEEICFNPTLYSSLLTKKSITHLFGKGNGFIIVYKQDNKIAGYAQITFRRNLAAGRFYSLAVHPDFQGKGVASNLFLSVEKICKAIGAFNVLLEIREDNDTLKSRYEKLGYKEYRLVKNYYPDGCAAIKMQRNVS